MPTTRRSIVVGLAAGLATSVLFTLAWPPFGMWMLAFVALAPLAWWLRRAPGERVGWKTAALVTFVTQYPAWAVLEGWIYDLTPPGYVVLCAYCSGYAALFAVIFRAVATSSRFERWPAALLLPIAYGGVEYLRTTLVLGGYPWFQLGIPLAGAADGSGIAAQSASLFGSHWLTFLAASAAGAIVDLITMRRRALVVAGAVIALQIANVAFGWFLKQAATTTPGPVVVSIQTNLSVSNKIAWARADQLRDVKSFMDLTVDTCNKAVAAGLVPDLVIWPETMIPGFGLEAEAIRVCEEERQYPGGLYADALRQLRDVVRAPIMVGAASYFGLRVKDEHWEWDRHHNSVYLVDGDMPYRRYDKLVLTPFGEEMPLISRWKWLEQRLLAIGAPAMKFDLSPGAGPVRFDIAYGDGRTARIATPICFEDTVGWLCRALCYERGAKVVDLMVNSSNDGWLGTSQAGREQHVLHARLRSIELAVPMVRCANTGLSVVIDDRGRVVRSIGGAAPGRGSISGAIVAAVDLTDRSTLYAVLGDAWPWTMLVAMVALVSIARFGRNGPTGARAMDARSSTLR